MSNGNEERSLDKLSAGELIGRYRDLRQRHVDSFREEDPLDDEHGAMVNDLSLGDECRRVWEQLQVADLSQLSSRELISAVNEGVINTPRGRSELSRRQKNGGDDAGELVQIGTENLNNIDLPAEQASELITNVKWIEELTPRRGLIPVLTEQLAFTHSPDYRSVAVGRDNFSLTSGQAQVIRILAENKQAGHPDVGTAYLLEKLETANKRLRDTFKSNPKAWKALVVPGNTRGTVRLRN